MTWVTGEGRPREQTSELVGVVGRHAGCCVQGSIAGGRLATIVGMMGSRANLG